MDVANTLAYYDMATITAVKSCISVCDGTSHIFQNMGSLFEGSTALSVSALTSLANIRLARKKLDRDPKEAP